MFALKRFVPWTNAPWAAAASFLTSHMEPSHLQKDLRSSPQRAAWPTIKLIYSNTFPACIQPSLHAGGTADRCRDREQIFFLMFAENRATKEASEREAGAVPLRLHLLLLLLFYLSAACWLRRQTGRMEGWMEKWRGVCLGHVCVFFVSRGSCAFGDVSGPLPLKSVWGGSK